MLIIGILSILFLFFVLQSSFNIGDAIINRLHLGINHWLKFMIGFIVILAIFQIIYYPAQWFQFSSDYLFYSGLIVVFLLLLFDARHWRNVKEVFFHKELWIILGMAFVLFFLYMRTTPHAYWFFDDSFYLPFMYENAHADHILSIEARSGFDVLKVINLYSYQGYYLVGSFLIQVVDYLGKLLSFSRHYLSVVYYFMSMPIFVFLLIGIYGLGKQIAKSGKEKFLFYGLSVFYVVFLPFTANILNNVLMNGYIGIFTLATVFIPLIIFFAFEYLKGKREYIPLLFFSFIMLLSIASSSMFLIFIILYTMFVYLILKKQTIHFEDFLLISLPLFVYLISFVFHQSNLIIILALILLTILYGFYFYIGRKKQWLEKIFTKIVSVLVIAFPFLVIVISFFLNIFKKALINCNGFFVELIDTLFPVYGNLEFYYIFVPITLFYILVIVAYIFRYIKTKKVEMDSIWVLTILFVFFNPLTISFISTFLTASVYQRILILFLNPFVLYFLFRDIMKLLPYNKMATFIITCFILLPIILLLKDFNHWVSISGRSDKLVRMSQTSMEGYEVIKKYIDENHLERPLLASVSVNEFRVLDPNIEMQFTRLYEFKPDYTAKKEAYEKDVLYHFLSGKITKEEILTYGSIPNIILNNHISFVIIDEFELEEHLLDETYKKQYDLFLKVYPEIYATDNYKIYYTEKGNNL